MKLPGILFKQSFYKWLTLIWAIIIVTISSIPNLPNPELKTFDIFEIRLDYIFHFLVFFMLGISVVMWQTPDSLKLKTKYLLYILLAGTIFGAADEAHQLVIPGRRYNPIDLFYNLLGFWAGVLLTYFCIIRFLIVKRQRFSGYMARIQKRGKKTGKSVI